MDSPLPHWEVERRRDASREKNILEAERERAHPTRPEKATISEAEERSARKQTPILEPGFNMGGPSFVEVVAVLIATAVITIGGGLFVFWVCGMI